MLNHAPQRFVGDIRLYYDGTDFTLHYLGIDNLYHQFAAIEPLRGTQWYNLKMRCAFADVKYRDCFFNGITYDLSDILLLSDLNYNKRCSSVLVALENRVAAIANALVDDATVTYNET